MEHSEPSEHHKKMAARKLGRAKRLGFAERAESVKRQVQNFCEYWRGVRRKNGVGSRSRREGVQARRGIGATP